MRDTIDIKICGLSTPEAINAVIRNGATHAGFIFFPKSPRNVTPQAAAPLAAQAMAAGVLPVAVTVDAEDALLDAIVETMRPAMLQLHGMETPHRVAELKVRHGLPVIKALSISTAGDFDKAVPFRGVVDRFLFDARPPAGSQLPGGNAVSFDWHLLRSAAGLGPYFLAGGIHPANAAQALAIANPPGLDISSGVESAPGIKDTGLIDAFFAAIRHR